MSITIVAIGVLAGMATQYVPDLGEFLHDRDVRAAGLQRYWEADLPAKTGDEIVQTHHLDGTLYLLTREGDVAAVDGATGILQWIRNIESGRYQVHRPTHFSTADGRQLTMVTSGRRAFIFDRHNGDTVTEFEVTFGATSAGVADPAYVFIGGSDGKMHCLQWNHQYGHQAIRSWEVLAGGPIQSTPILSGENLFMASAGGQVYSCKAFSRQLNWSFDAGGAILGDIVQSDGSIFVASADRAVYRLDEFSGVPRWRALLPAPPREGPRVSGREVFQAVPENGLYAFDLDTGAILWQRPDAAEPVARSLDRLYLRGPDNDHVFIVDGRTGKPFAELETYGSSAIFGHPNADSIFLVSKSRRLLCLRPLDAGPPSAPGQGPAAATTQEADSPESGESRSTPTERDVLNDPLRSRRDLPAAAGQPAPE